jgi:hypothetical protein
MSASRSRSRSADEDAFDDTRRIAPNAYALQALVSQGKSSKQLLDVHAQVVQAQSNRAESDAMALSQDVHQALLDAHKDLEKIGRVTAAIREATDAFHSYLDGAIGEHRGDSEDWMDSVERKHGKTLEKAIKKEKKRLRPGSRSYSPTSRKAERQAREEERLSQFHANAVAAEKTRAKEEENSAAEWARANASSLAWSREQGKKNKEEIEREKAYTKALRAAFVDSVEDRAARIAAKRRQRL